MYPLCSLPCLHRRRHLLSSFGDSRSKRTTSFSTTAATSRASKTGVDIVRGNDRHVQIPRFVLLDGIDTGHALMRPDGQFRELLLIPVLQNLRRNQSEGGKPLPQRVSDGRERKTLPRRRIRFAVDSKGSVVVPTKLLAVLFADGCAVVRYRRRRRIIRRRR